MLVGFQCLSPLGVLADVVTKLPSLELSIVVELPTMIVGGLGPYTQVHFIVIVPSSPCGPNGLS